MLIKLKYFFNLFVILMVIYFFISTTPHLDKTNLTMINTYLIMWFIGLYAVNNFINASILKEVHKKTKGVFNDTKK